MSAPPDASASAPVSVEAQGERVTLILRRLLRHPPDAVWKAITDPEAIRQWFLTSSVIEGRVGGKVDMVTGPYRMHGTGEVLAWDPPRLLEYEYHVAPGAAFPEGAQTVLRWELVPQEEGTLLVLTLRGLPRRTAVPFTSGVKGFFDRLEALLDGRPLPDWPARSP